jgi:hypothetical protein
MSDEREAAKLPGEELVQRGIRDLERGSESVESLAIGAPRLRRAGFSIPTPVPEPETRLYRLLQERHGDAAHGRYNALVRRLVTGGSYTVTAP